MLEARPVLESVGTAYDTDKDALARHLKHTFLGQWEFSPAAGAPPELTSGGAPHLQSMWDMVSVA
jgi:hypothetical protein